MTLSALADPTYFYHPDYHSTLGPEVGELATLAGFPPDPEQQLALDPTFGMDRFGRSVAFEVCLICCRQNLKTGFFKIVALGKVFLLERPLFVWSAHEFSTTQEAFRDLMIMIESCPTLDRQVKAIHRASGAEAIELLGGQRIKFKARTKSGGRGLTGDDVCLDEAFALQPAHMGALLPTLSARPDPQVLYGSSAGLADSAVLRDIRDRGRAGGERRLVYVEWCAPEGGCGQQQCDHRLDAVDCALDDETNWALANPALGRRITIDYIRNERRALPALEFARERLGWWDDPGLESAALDIHRWNALADPASAAERVDAFGIEVSLDRASAAIGMAGTRCTCAPPLEPCDARVHLEAIDRRSGTEWVVPRCVELNQAHGPAVFVVDSGGPAASLIEDLQGAGLTVVVTSTSDIGGACAGLVDAVTQGTVVHGPQPELEQAVRGARKRPIGDGRFAFGRKASDIDISPLVAVTLAHWAAVNRPPVNVLNSIW